MMREMSYKSCKGLYKSYFRSILSPNAGIPAYQTSLSLNHLHPLAINSAFQFESFKTCIRQNHYFNKTNYQFCGSNQITLLRLSHATDFGKQKRHFSVSSESVEDEEELYESNKKKILNAALSHVMKLGWTESALFEGARQSNLSPSILSIFPRKEAHLVEFFMDECLQKFNTEIEEIKEDLSYLPIHEKICFVLKKRLEIQSEYVSSWSQALSIQARPENVSTSLSQRAQLAERFCTVIEDSDSDRQMYQIDGWISKRLMMIGLYSSAEIYMITDFSAGFQDTWSFLERQIENFINAKNTTTEASRFLWTFGSGMLQQFRKSFEK